MTGVLVAVATLAVGTLLGVALRRREGRVREVTGAERLTAAELGAELGERATLVQFSTAFCRPCQATRRILADVAALVPGVRHVEIDAASRLDLARRFEVLTTPTVLLLDAAGRVARRASGLPSKPQVLAALEAVLTDGNDQ